MSEYPRNGAFAKGLSLLHCDWVDVEIISEPFISAAGHTVITVWVPSENGEHAITNAALNMLSPRSRLARELLVLSPRPPEVTP